MTDVRARGLRSYISEPRRGRRNWKRNRDAPPPTYANRWRIRGRRGKRLWRQRGEQVERGFAHMLVTGGLRRVPVRGPEEIRKRLLIQAAAFNLGLLIRQRYGVGTPRGRQDLVAVRAVLARPAGSAIWRFFRSFGRFTGLWGPIPGFSGRRIRLELKFFPISALAPLFHPAL